MTAGRSRAVAYRDMKSFPVMMYEQQPNGPGDIRFDPQLGPPSMQDEYMSAFFVTNELAAGTVIDGKMEWTFNKYWTKYVVKLINHDARMVGEDVDGTELGSHVDNDAAGMTTPYLITRQLSRGVVANVLADAHPGSN
jgi:hypothetical protein